MGAPAWRGWGALQRAPVAQDQVFVSRVVADPAVQGVTRLLLHAAVGKADGECHESCQVVRLELQTPAAGETD